MGGALGSCEETCEGRRQVVVGEGSLLANWLIGGLVSVRGVGHALVVNGEWTGLVFSFAYGSGHTPFSLILIDYFLLTIALCWILAY